MAKAIGYVRVSTEDQAMHGYSIEHQVKKIQMWASLNDHSLELYYDEGVSGTKTDRMGLTDAVNALSRGDILVVYSLSRLSRNTRHTMDLADTIEKRQADLVSLNEKIDTTSAAGKMIFRLLAVLNEFERDQISERTKAVLQHKKAQGQRTGTTPFGHTVEDGSKTLVEDPREQQIIKQIIKLHKKGLSLRKIALHLAKKGITSPRSGKPLGHIQVDRIIKQATKPVKA